MKIRKTTPIALALIISGIFFQSCKHKPESAPVADPQDETTSQEMARKSEEAIVDYYPGANFMQVLAAPRNDLGLNDEQEKILSEWRKGNHSKIETEMKALAALEKEIHSLSMLKADTVALFEKARETGKLRKEIAATKLQCRELIMNTLLPEQWDALVLKYQNEHPFKERIKRMEVMQHVNPVPNYIQAINRDAGTLGITPEQKTIFDAWIADHHPKMDEMANQISALEKETYQASLQKGAQEEILAKIDQIEVLRKEVVTMKTNCRDMVLSTLTPEQWRLLVEKIK